MADDKLRAAEQQLVECAQVLAQGIGKALPQWVVSAVESRLPELDSEVRQAAVAAGEAAAAEVGAEVARLLAADIDELPENPLAVLRRAVRYPTEVLFAAGAAPVERDDYAIERFPNDVYDLTPASFADIHPDLQTPGLTWGAAKAFVYRRRHL
ncbi:hypothetical protein [Candidatus Poriferisocius sp.]|uniref:hypothetical protein n=1 Tax=Candidatus Poriferisocius sp. TaxID=3101276 RepID=UPI003B0122F6